MTENLTVLLGGLFGLFKIILSRILVLNKTTEFSTKILNFLIPISLQPDISNNIILSKRIGCVWQKLLYLKNMSKKRFLDLKFSIIKYS